MAYLVLSNRKPANKKNVHTVVNSWNREYFETFETFDEAYEYAKNWFYPFGERLPEEYLKGFDYSGYGDTAQIVEIF